LVKELVLVDPEAGLTAGQLVSRQLPRLPADTPLYQLLRLFEAGGSHMVALTKPITGQLQASGSYRASHEPTAAAAGGSLSPHGGYASPVFTSPAKLGSGGNALQQLGQQQQQQQQHWSGGSAVPSRCGTPQLGAASQQQQQQQGLPRIKSGVIKAGDNMIYVEAQSAPALPPQQQQQQHGADGVDGIGAAAAGGGGGAWMGAEAAAAAAWAHLREGDPVGIITIEDVIEEVRASHNKVLHEHQNTQCYFGRRVVDQQQPCCVLLLLWSARGGSSKDKRKGYSGLHCNSLVSLWNGPTLHASCCSRFCCCLLCVLHLQQRMNQTTFFCSLKYLLAATAAAAAVLFVCIACAAAAAGDHR
jgi:hypothetical protein